MALMQRTGETPAERKERTNTDAVSLEETSNVEKENLEFSSVVAYVKNQFQKAKDKRRSDEDRWLMAWRNFRGIYGPEVQFTDTEKSQAFIKITKTKVLAAAAQIVDVLFAGGKFPITVQPTPVPIGTMEAVNVETGNKPPSAPKPQGSQLRSTTSRLSIATAIAPVADKLEGITEDKIEEGRGTSPTSVTYEPAQIAARLMDKQIQDQLAEANADKVLRSVALEMALLGGGFVKGPFTNEKEYPKWDSSGEYIPEKVTTPDISFVSTWNAYPDPDARNMSESESFIERHRMSRTDLKNLKKMTGFRSKSIDMAIDMGPDYRKEYWEDVIDDTNTAYEVERYEVLEFWGMIDKDTADVDLDFDIPSALKDMDQIQVNIWVCNGQVIRMLLNPFTPVRIPYHYVPYELNPYSFFGIGVAENMEDTQLLMNGFMRMAVDNAALSGNLIIEVDESRLAPGQSLDVYPGKVFRRDGGAPGQAIFGTSFPNISNELFMMFDKARQLADESTGIPSYAHGGTGVPGVGRTASGMSMLMGAAAQNIKAVVRNIDDYLLGPLAKDFFAFNMQFKFDQKFTQGDLEVVALGTESLMRNEIRSQRILQLMQTTAGNPATAPLVKWDELLREYVTSIDLEEDKFVNDPRAAMLQAMLMRTYAETMGPANAQQPQGQGTPNGAPNPNDPTGTGNGNIAPGNAPQPGAEGFTGSGGASGAGAQANAQAAQQPQGAM